MEQLELSNLEQKLYEKMQWAEAKLAEQKTLVQKAANSEKAYRMALASKMISLKSEGQNATIIPDIARGDALVADLKWQRDVDDGILDACKNAIKILSGEMTGFQTLINRHRAEMNLR